MNLVDAQISQLRHGNVIEMRPEEPVLANQLVTVKTIKPYCTMLRNHAL